MLRQTRLEDRYDLNQTSVLLTGTQAIIRAALTQKKIDQEIGLDTGGYVTGYRGSPLGALDQQIGLQLALLQAQDIHFNPGLNEDLAATALWGTQQAEMRGEGRLDGVFGIWYGKGPGVDRSGDALRHANLAGSSAHGGVIALMGDDHMCESSTTAHHSEYAFMDAMIPILHPAGVQEIYEYCLAGWALSRLSGCWVGIKLVKDSVESTAVIDAPVTGPELPNPQLPPLPPGGVNIRPGDTPLAQEQRLIEQKIPLFRQLVRQFNLDRMIWQGGPAPRIGIVTTGKSYLDVLEALDVLGIDETSAANLGLRLMKLGCVWPLDPTAIDQFAAGLDQILVVEEKRPVIEPQLKDLLYGRPDRPVIHGKKGPSGDWLLPAAGVLDPIRIADAIAQLIESQSVPAELAAAIAAARARMKTAAAATDIAARPPHFCAGCPHNRSTVVPDGMRAYAGIGCHYLVQGMDRANEGYTHMGAEGANWIGEQLFSTRSHMFQNIGDGTYSHSGIMAIRAAHAAGANITFKILYNDAVALTGGQSLEGDLSVQDIARDMQALDLPRVCVVTDEPDKYPAGYLPTGVSVHHRDEIIDLQQQLAEVTGVTALIYDQTCAAEKRRRRKRGTYPDPDVRVVINDRICEGCGDCGVKSNCVAIQPEETVFGRKRRIDQSACNKDLSCLDGFCPSFVTVHGAELAKADIAESAKSIPDPVLPAVDGNYAILVTGIGGTGVVTIGAVLAMAAHLEHKATGVIDMSGLAQKGGAVYSHIRIAKSPEDISAIRVSAGGADLLLGCDIAVAGTSKALATLSAERSSLVLNTHEVMPGKFTRDTAFQLPSAAVSEQLERLVSEQRRWSFDATALATALCGDGIATNMMMLGFAYQQGKVPLSEQALLAAIELNGAAVSMNKAAFAWGRRAAVDLDEVVGIAFGTTKEPSEPANLEARIQHYAEDLEQYHNRTYRRQYEQLMAAFAAHTGESEAASALCSTVALQLYRLMAIKDEFEVARLMTGAEFGSQLKQLFQAPGTLNFYLAPPLLARKDKRTGLPKKRRYGAWMLPVLRTLAACRRLRNSIFDPFRYTDDRRRDLALLKQYQGDCQHVLDNWPDLTADQAHELLHYPATVAGFGHVRAASHDKALEERRQAWARLKNPGDSSAPGVAA